MYGDGITSVNRLPDPIPIYPRRVAPRPRLHTQARFMIIFCPLWIYVLALRFVYIGAIENIFPVRSKCVLCSSVALLAKKNLTRKNVNNV